MLQGPRIYPKWPAATNQPQSNVARRIMQNKIPTGQGVLN
jgi:hypothetical protein